MSRKFKKIEQATWVSFDKITNKTEGEVIKVDEKENDYGLQRYIVLRTDDGTLLNVGLSAGLNNIVWENLIGEYVLIEYLGEKVNLKNKRTFKNFQVSIAE